MLPILLPYPDCSNLHINSSIYIVKNKGELADPSLTSVVTLNLVDVQPSHLAYALPLAVPYLNSSAVIITIIIIIIIIMNLYSAGSISQNTHRCCNVCVVTFYSI